MNLWRCPTCNAACGGEFCPQCQGASDGTIDPDDAAAIEAAVRAHFEPHLSGVIALPPQIEYITTTIRFKKPPGEP